jgi:hypothetical protein
VVGWLDDVSRQGGGGVICAEPTCSSPVRARGLCNRHYLRAWNDGTLDLVAPLRTPAQRFWAKVDRDHPSGCWLWTASTDPAGYGRFSTNEIALPSTLAHRIAYTWIEGEIPEGLVLDHLCRTPACVNPAHLDPVSHGENTRRGVRWNSHKTKCKHGHPFDEANTYVHANGKRSCRICRRRWVREYQLRKQVA